MTFRKTLLATPLLVLLVLFACTESEPLPAEQRAQKASAPADKSYRVKESFNVGRQVFVRALAVDEARQTLWVGTSVGGVEVDLSTGEARDKVTRENGLANEYVFAAMVDHQGELWMGTNGGGVSRRSTQGWKTYFPMHGLADYWVYSFAERANQDIWIGTWAGVSVFHRQTGRFTNYVKELVNEWVYGLDVDSQDRVWIGTEGGVNMYDGQRWHTWTHADGLGAPNSRQLPFSDNTGLGTRSRHDLSVLAQGKATYNPNYVFSMLVTAGDNVWAGTWGGGASRFDGKDWHNVTREQGLAGNIVYSLAEDVSGNLWFGTNAGLSRFDGRNWQTFTRQDGLLDNHVYALATTGAGDVWAGTRNGVARIVRQP